MKKYLKLAAEIVMWFVVLNVATCLLVMWVGYMGAHFMPWAVHLFATH